MPERAVVQDAVVPIAEVVARTGLSADTLRFYERRGLLPPVTRTSGGQRRYTGRDLERLEPSRRLHAALTACYDDPSRVDLVVVPGMAHALADEPGIDSAPQTPAAAAVDRHAAAWLRQHLPAPAGAAAEPA